MCNHGLDALAEGCIARVLLQETMLADCDARVASISGDARKARSSLVAAANASIRTLHAHLSRSLSGLRSTCAALAEPASPKPQAPALPAAANVATRPSSTRHSSHRWSQLNDILRTAPVELCWAQSSPWQSPRISLVRQYNLAPLDAGGGPRRDST